MSKRNSTPVSQYEGTTLLARYPSIALASKISKTQPAHIGKVASGIRTKAGGYSWKSMKSFTTSSMTKKGGVSQLDLNGNVVAVYSTAEVAANMSGVNVKMINKVVAGTSKRAGGFIWS